MVNNNEFIEIKKIANELFAVHNNPTFFKAIYALTGSEFLTVDNIVNLQKLGFAFYTIN
jgi:hypothetical protein